MGVNLERDELFYEYLEVAANKARRRVEGLRKSKKPKDLLRLEEELRLCEALKKEAIKKRYRGSNNDDSS